MHDPQNPDRAEIEARLARTREELLALFQPQIDARAAELQNPGEVFPRSRTFRLLLSYKGLGAVGVAACGFLLARPALAMRLIRLVPVTALARMLLRRQLMPRESA